MKIKVFEREDVRTFLGGNTFTCELHYRDGKLQDISLAENEMPVRYFRIKDEKELDEVIEVLTEAKNLLEQG